MATLAQPSPRREPHNRIVTLAGLFWAFSYVLLSVRGALFFDDWTRLIDDNRLVTVTLGAGAFALVLKQLEVGRRITLGAVLTWIAGATLGVLIVRMTIDQMLFDAPQGMGVNLLYSLSWSAYFGLWVMGSLAFAPVDAPVRASKPVVASVAATDVSANPQALETLIAALIDEAADLGSLDRSALAQRVLAAGGYEELGGDTARNERARLAVRIAARLADGV